MPPPRVWPVPAAAPGSRLRDCIETDVLVIGAGFAGLVAALELAEAGRSVVLLEAGDIGDCASAASAGQVAPFLYGARQTPAQVARRLGPERGVRLNRAVAGSGRWLFDRIAALGIDCDARRGLVTVHRQEKGLERGAALAAQWETHGLRAEPLDRDALDAFVRSDRYAGGFLWREGGVVDPTRLVHGLAAAARRVGVRIHTHSPVGLIVRMRDGRQEALTGDASVTAAQIIVATGSAGLGCWPELGRAVYAVPCGLAATAPLPDRAAAILPHGGPIADMDDMAVFSPAVSADGRLVVSFLMDGMRADLAHAPGPALRRLARAFPDWSPPPFETLSWGKIAITPDGLPRVIRDAHGTIAVTGCNGAGLTLGILAAREAVRLVLGTPAEDLVLPVSSAAALPLARTMPMVLRNLLAPIANRLGA
jgi:glycine/D-amino acid oxidase-like deaminating enzyme